MNSKIKNIVIPLIAVVLSFLVVLSCDDNPVQNGDDNITPGSRNYAWEVDTLDIPLNDLRAMWGSSPEDVWTFGGGGHLADLVWHFDGNTWSSYGEFVGTDPFGIKGFALNDIWIGGQLGSISYYNGTKWEKVYQIPNPGYYDFYGIQDFAGTSSNDMYAVGFADSAGIRLSLMYYYNGFSWSKLSTKGFNMNFYRINKEENNQRYYITGFAPGFNSAVLLENGKLELIEEDIRGGETNIITQKIGDKVYMTKGQEIYMLNGKEKRLIYRVNDSNFGLQSYGRSEKDIFLRMFDGVAHYNGTNHEYLFRFEGDKSIRDIEVFEKDVFVLMYDWDNNFNIIYRGKLLE